MTIFGASIEIELSSRWCGGGRVWVTVSGDGVSTVAVNESNGDGFGVANNTTMTVMGLLLATDAKAVKGILYNGEATKGSYANKVYSALNEAGRALVNARHVHRPGSCKRPARFAPTSPGKTSKAPADASDPSQGRVDSTGGLVPMPGKRDRSENNARNHSLGVQIWRFCHAERPLRRPTIGIGLYLQGAMRREIPRLLIGYVRARRPPGCGGDAKAGATPSVGLRRPGGGT